MASSLPLAGYPTEMTFCVSDSIPVFHYNWFDEKHYVVKSEKLLPKGENKLRSDRLTPAAQIFELSSGRFV
jgi:hypothetical protein